MEDYWLFVFVTAPGSPLHATGIFPPEMEEEAVKYAEDGNGYRTIRKSTWKFGPLPHYNDTIPFE